ncbi:MAG TPA: type II secretion system protein GspM [Bryobacteraceae bacterium]|jgi:type II secretory pathway component PulM|nr:type II secretion system protein GspM [Bryobacteraceae bacterium]
MRRLEPREKKAVIALGATLALSVVVLAYEFWPAGTAAVAAAAPQSVAQMEQRLARVRETAATVPGKQEILKKVAGDLAIRENGMIRAETAPQAQAQVVSILRDLAASESLQLRNYELGAIAPFGDDYGAVNVSIQVECRIEQLLNFLAALAARPELIATRDLRVIAADPKQKTLNVRITVAGIVPKSLAPKKGG